ncbi:MAG: histidinol-phosphate transaminase [Trichlorobacter sp.]|nr:histidinol-phosphate transaminase [Trichlorobacter sp.]
MKILRQNIKEMAGYIPGFQPPDIANWVKLNTNENPYPPSPRVKMAILEELGADATLLRTYPSAGSERLREEVGYLYGFDPAWVIMANGSDELLNNLIRACAAEGEEIAYVHPSYSYYATLAQVQGAKVRTFGLTDDRQQLADFPERYNGKLLFLTTPNSPLGFSFKLDYIAELAERCDGLLIIDEAYADFNEYNALDLVRQYENVVITRTMSKSYALAGMRLGFAIARPAVIAALDKIRDHYNLDRLAQVACLAALQDQDYFMQQRNKVVDTRNWFSRAVVAAGFQVLPSSGNFLFVIPPDLDGWKMYDNLYRHLVLVRYFADPLLAHGVRISIGTDEEMERTLAVLALSQEIKG